MDTIYKRRSIRKFRDGEIDQKKIEKIIRAGMNAPSAGNEQPWHFIVVRDRGKLEAITKVHPHSSMLRGADVAILLCGDITLEQYEGFWVQDCSAAAENMLLEITDMGLGSVWLGVYPIRERIDGVREIFALPENIFPFAVFPVGYPGEEKKENNRFDPARIHFDTW